MELSRRSFLRGITAGTASMALAACKEEGTAQAGQNNTNQEQAKQRAETCKIWCNEILDCIRTLKPAPPVSARALAMVSTAMYDAWAAYDKRALGTQLGAQLRRPPNEHKLDNKQKAISYAAYRTLLNLFPARAQSFADKMTALGYNPSDASSDLTSPVGIGNRAAAALIAYRSTDNSNQANGYADTSGYTPINTADTINDVTRWQPLRVNGNVQKFAVPHWGRVTPFALGSGSAVRPSIVLPAANSTAFRQQARTVLDFAAYLDDETKTISTYWADGPGSEQPPGHWFALAQEIAKQRGYDLDEEIKLFFMLGNGLMDAGIACWDCKRAYDSVRPITAIRQLFAGTQVRSFGGPTVGMTMMDGSVWMPYQAVNFVTPPFAEFTSGHSTFSMASAEILTRFTMSPNMNMTVTVPAASSPIEANTPRAPVTLRWRTFYEAAQQAGLSRLYGGIHFEAANEYGQRMGRAIGGMVFEKAMRLIDGRG